MGSKEFEASRDLSPTATVATPIEALPDGHEKTGWELRYDELHVPGAPMPGPWAWEVHDHSMATLCGGGEDAIVGHIMDVNPCSACADRASPAEWVWGRCATPTIENARLIAAAPDLLEALICIEAETADYMRINNLGDPAKQHANRMARAAIAKATGQGEVS